MREAPKVPDSSEVLKDHDIIVLEYDTGPLPNYPEAINAAVNRLGRKWAGLFYHGVVRYTIRISLYTIRV